MKKIWDFQDNFLFVWLFGSTSRLRSFHKLNYKLLFILLNRYNKNFKTLTIEMILNDFGCKITCFTFPITIFHLKRFLNFFWTNLRINLKTNFYAHSFWREQYQNSLQNKEKTFQKTKDLCKTKRNSVQVNGALYSMNTAFRLALKDQHRRQWN